MSVNKTLLALTMAYEQQQAQTKIRMNLVLYDGRVKISFQAPMTLIVSASARG